MNSIIAAPVSRGRSVSSTKARAEFLHRSLSDWSAF